MALPTPYRPDPAPSTGAMNAEMNVTPMLDVMLVLLIVFMTMLIARMSIEAHLPDPNALGQADAVPIVLEVGPRGYYAVNKQVIPTDSIATRLKAIYADRPDKRIILHGARDARYQEIVTAMDIARGAGVTVIGTEMRGALPLQPGGPPPTPARDIPR